MGERAAGPARGAGEQAAAAVRRTRLYARNWLAHLARRTGERGGAGPGVFADLQLDAEIPRLREAPRVVRILFAGNQDAEAYGPMAVGTVPVTEYGGFLPVPLEHRRNCIAFRGRAELPDVLREVLAMHRSDVERMRREAIRYYEEHLAPASFGRRLAAVPAGEVTAYMAAEDASVRAMDAARGGAGAGDPG